MTDSSKYQVMVIDDDPSILLTVQKVLESAGISVKAVTGGSVCLDELRRGFRGVMLMDAMMPGLNGWETIRRIRAENLLEGNIICMLTAMDTPDESLDRMKDCVLDYIHKPFDPAALIERVREYLTYLN